MSTGVLNHLRARLVGWLAFRTLLLMVTAFAGVALALVLADAALDLDEAWRVAAPWFFAAGVLMVLVAAGNSFIATRRMAAGATV